MKYVQWFAWCVNLPLQVALLNSLFRGGFRSFPVLLPYSLILFLWTVANIAAREGGRLPAAWQSAYWLVDLILDWLLYVLILSLVNRAVRQSQHRAKIVRWLILAVGLFWLAALFLTYDPRLNEWMTNFTKYVAFGGAVLNLVLWTVLVGTHHGDRSVLMISGGYGVQSAGEAISQSLRALAIQNRSYPVLITGNLIGVLTHTLCLVIWWRAVARENTQRTARPLTGVSSEE
ncbi:MAG: hypothetical protein NT090_07115 [Acidobacteria bacterium]|nr:hypothetical protein [Acidobacteriota bacterium]